MSLAIVVILGALVLGGYALAGLVISAAAWTGLGRRINKRRPVGTIGLRGDRPVIRGTTKGTGGE